MLIVMTAGATPQQVEQVGGETSHSARLAIDRIDRGPEDLHTVRLEGFREIKRRLSPELQYDAERFLTLPARL